MLIKIIDELCEVAAVLIKVTAVQIASFVVLFDVTGVLIEVIIVLCEDTCVLINVSGVLLKSMVSYFKSLVC